MTPTEIKSKCLVNSLYRDYDAIRDLCDVVTGLQAWQSGHSALVHRFQNDNDANRQRGESLLEAGNEVGLLMRENSELQTISHQQTLDIEMLKEKNKQLLEDNERLKGIHEDDLKEIEDRQKTIEDYWHRIGKKIDRILKLETDLANEQASSGQLLMGAKNNYEQLEQQLVATHASYREQIETLNANLKLAEGQASYEVAAEWRDRCHKAESDLVKLITLYREARDKLMVQDGHGHIASHRWNDARNKETEAALEAVKGGEGTK